MHRFHDGGIRVAHYTGHLLHERAFWEILALVVLIAGMFALVVLYGSGSMMQHYHVPYGPYY
jgi:hypothetical protein